MEVGKKYRGSMNKALLHYVREKEEELKKADGTRGIHHAFRGVT